MNVHKLRRKLQAAWKRSPQSDHRKFDLPYRGSKAAFGSAPIEALEARIAPASVGVAIDDNSSKLLIFDPATGAQTGVVTLPTSDSTLDAVVSPDGHFAYVSAFSTREIFVVDLVTKSLASGANPMMFGTPVEDLVISPDGRYLLASDGGGANPIYVVDTATRATVFTLNDSAGFHAVEVTAAGDVLASSFDLGVARHYTLNGAGALTYTGQSVLGAGFNTTAAPDGVTALGTSLGGITSFVISGMTPVASVSLGNVVSMAFNLDGTKLYARTSSGNVVGYNYNPATGFIGSQLFNIGGLASAITYFGVDQLDVSTDGSRVYVSSGSQVVALDAATGANLGAISISGAGFVGIDIAGALEVNDAPTVVVPGGKTVAEDTSLSISGISIGDVDAGNGNVSVTLAVQHGVVTASDAGLASITGNGSGSVVLTGTVAAINASLAGGVTYKGALNYNGSDLLSVTANDLGNTGIGGALSAIGTVGITVTAVNDAPVLLAGSGQSATFVEDGSAVVVDPSLSLTDVDVATTDPVLGHGTLNSARVIIGAGFVAGQDTLHFTAQHGITGSYNASTGVLTLSGSASIADYEAALRSVSYSNSSQNPSTANRTITFSVSEGSALSDGNHFYEFVSAQGISWTAARDAAASRTLNGLQGYLATITSADENAFATAKLQGVGWIGGSDAAVEGEWRWVTGPEGLEAGGAGRLFWLGNTAATGGHVVPGQYANWNGTGEPNNVGTNPGEDYAHMIFNTAIGARGSWNDLPNAGGTGDYTPQGYIVEYGGMPNEAAVTVTASKTLGVAAVNDAPVVTAPGGKTVNEDTGLLITGISVADVDANSGNLSVTLSVTSGNLTANGSGGVTVVGNGSGSVVLTGTLNAINASLATGVNYLGNLNFYGQDSLNISVNDQGNTGSGAPMPLTGSNSVGIAVLPVNDAVVINPNSLALTANSIVEGGSTALSGSISDPDPLDAHTVTINWGDGSPATVVNLAPGVLNFSNIVHQYRDDNPSGSLVDANNIQVTVTDALTSDTKSTSIQVSNVRPTLALNPVAAINESGIATLTGSFSDIGLQDTHKVVVNWGDANNASNSSFELNATSALHAGDTLNSTDGATLTITAVDQATGTVSYSVQHQYRDDGASLGGGNGTSSDQSTISVTVSDDDGGTNTSTTQVTVQNVAPTLSNVAVTPVINENGVATLAGSFSDIGLQDTHTLTVNWGDANNASNSSFELNATSALHAGDTLSSTDGATLTITAVDQATGTVSYSVQHQYRDDGASLGGGNGTSSDQSTISVTVSDDDGGTNTSTTEVTVQNVAPTLSNVAVTPVINENGVATLTGSFSDIGLQDTHTLTVNWGDANNGALSTFSLGATGTLSPSTISNSTDGATLTITAIDSTTGTVSYSVQHHYKDDGVSLGGGNGTSSDQSTISVTVSDDDGGTNTSTTEVTVQNAGPTLALNPVATIHENGVATLTGSFSDIGLQDTHKVVVNWGDANNTSSSSFELNATSALHAGDTLNSTDGATLTITAVDQATGTVSYSVQHQYRDDGASLGGGNGTSSDQSTISVTVSDDDGGTNTSTTEVTVQNVAPTLSNVAVTPVINENGVATLTGSFSDIGLQDTHTLTVNWGDANNANNSSFELNSTSGLHTGDTLSSADGATLTITAVDQATGTVSYSVQHQYRDDGASLGGGNGTSSDQSTISVTVSDDDGGAVSSTTSVMVNNVGPVVTPGSVLISAVPGGDTRVGDKVSLSAAFTDIGTLDTHTILIDWGDGTTSSSAVDPSNFTALSNSGGGAGSFTATHQYTTGGVFKVTFTVVDDDTGATVTSTEAWVTGMRLDPATGQLQIVGTSGRDHIKVQANSDNTQISVAAMFNQGVENAYGGTDLTVPLSAVKDIFVSLGNGDDHLDIHNSVKIASEVRGGAGNDYLSGGSGNDLIDGGDGDDLVFGNNGSDVLLGGAGNDTLKGGEDADVLSGGDGDDTLDAGQWKDVVIGGRGADIISGGNDGSGDLMIGGTTVYDNQGAALRNVLAKWIMNDTYENIVAALTTSGGLLEANVRVFDDQAIDRMAGMMAGHDLFFADGDKLGGDDDTLTGSKGDTVISVN